MASSVSASGDVPIRRLEPHPLPDPTAAFQWSEIFYDGMTHKNTHSLSHPNTPVSRNNNHHLEGNTTMGDTERRQPNAAWITTMWFSMNSPLVSQTGGREDGRRGGRRAEEQSLGKPLFFSVATVCCWPSKIGVSICAAFVSNYRARHVFCRAAIGAF